MDIYTRFDLPPPPPPTIFSRDHSDARARMPNFTSVTEVSDFVDAARLWRQTKAANIFLIFSTVYFLLVACIAFYVMSHKLYKRCFWVFRVMPNSWPSRLRRALRTTGLVAMPDGAMISFTQGGNLYYDSADGAPTLVTRQDGTSALEETSDAEDEEPLQHAGTAGTAGYTVPTSNAEDEVQDVGGSAPLQHAGTETALPSSPATVFSPATTRDDTPEPFITSSTPALLSLGLPPTSPPPATHSATSTPTPAALSSVPAASSASDLGPVSSGTRSSTSAPVSSGSSSSTSAPVSSGSSSSTSAPVSSGSSSSTSAPASRQQDEGNRTHRRAAAHLTLRLAHSTAARNAILGKAVSAGMSLWLLEDVLVFHPRSPPSCLRKTPGSKKAFFLSKTEQVKERWRCQAEGCDAVRTVDPNVTNVLHRHYKMAHQQHPSPKTLAS